MPLNKKLISFGPYFSHSSHLTYFVAFLYSFNNTQWDCWTKSRTCTDPFNMSRNLNSTRAHNFSKLNLLKTCVNVHKFDIIWSSETYLHSSVDDESLEISGYYLICSNYPFNKKPGGICIYYKNVSFLKVAGDHLLEKYITFDLIISNKLCSLFAFYRWPSQS